VFARKTSFNCFTILLLYYTFTVIVESYLKKEKFSICDLDPDPAKIFGFLRMWLWIQKPGVKANHKTPLLFPREAYGSLLVTLAQGGAAGGVQHELHQVHVVGLLPEHFIY
jgi:hypothetical protein